MNKRQLKVAAVVFGRMAFDLQYPGQYVRNVRVWTFAKVPRTWTL